MVSVAKGNLWEFFSNRRFTRGSFVAKAATSARGHRPAWGEREGDGNRRTSARASAHRISASACGWFVGGEDAGAASAASRRDAERLDSTRPAPTNAALLGKGVEHERRRARVRAPTCNMYSCARSDRPRSHRRATSGWSIKSLSQLSGPAGRRLAEAKNNAPFFPRKDQCRRRVGTARAG